MPTPCLDTEEREKSLQTLPEWVLAADAKSIERGFSFKNFTAAFAFMTKIAAQAEAINHHPDWSNVYNRVVIKLNTHEAGGLTARDIELAQKIDMIFKAASCN